MSGPVPKPFECREPVFWYLVGLIATDGCLSRDGRHIDITAKDKVFLEQLRQAAGLTCSIGVKKNGRGQTSHRLQISSRALYQRLLDLGLTPCKSLILGALRVPDSGFRDFFRGVIDGDGGIRRWQHPTNGHEQWAVRIHGASRPFLEWLQETADRLWKIKGRLHERRVGDERRHPILMLKFGKMAAKALLEECYYPHAVALRRKAMLAARCSRVTVGWSKSNTVTNSDRWALWTYQHAYPASPGELTDDQNAGIVCESFYN